MFLNSCNKIRGLPRKTTRLNYYKNIKILHSSSMYILLINALKHNLTMDLITTVLSK